MADAHAQHNSDTANPTGDKPKHGSNCSGGQCGC